MQCCQINKLTSDVLAQLEEANAPRSYDTSFLVEQVCRRIYCMAVMPNEAYY